MTEQNVQIKYPVWAFPLVVIVTGGSLYMTVHGAGIIASTWPWQARLGFQAVFVALSIFAVALGYVGRRNWAAGLYGASAGALVFALIVSSVNGLGTLRYMNQLFAQNEDALRVETSAEGQRADSIAQAQARIERAESAVRRASAVLAPLVDAVRSAQDAFDRERATGFGPRSEARQAELAAARRDAEPAQRRLAETESELAAAEAALADLLGAQVVTERSDAALVADRTSEIEELWTIYVGTLVIELAPLLSGWLLAMSVTHTRQDPMDRVIASMEAAQSRMFESQVEQSERIALMMQRFMASRMEAAFEEPPSVAPKALRRRDPNGRTFSDDLIAAVRRPAAGEIEQDQSVVSLDDAEPTRRRRTH